MKSVLKVCNMKTMVDVSNIRKAISKNQGIIACHISSEKGEVNVVYDDYFISLDDLVECIEDLGYTIL